MSPEIAAKIQEIRLALLNGDLTEEQEMLLVAEGVKMYREARGVVMEMAMKKAKEPKSTEPKVRRMKTKAQAGEDLLKQVLGETK
jgi:hypothetical protein